MGFRSTFVTDDSSWEWPDWFREKYAGNVHFPPETGPISSVREGKTYSVFADIPADIQRVLRETKDDTFDGRLVLVWLHECGGITRCQIDKTRIALSEPETWTQTSEVEHNYCYGCSDI
jgi:hypothetical protein